MSIELKLTQYEQDALADICTIVRPVATMLNSDSENEYVSKLLLSQLGDKIADSLMRFETVRWDMLYDKLHRSGANA